eukprot:2240286-Rhodomonas_salina.1
MLADQDINWLEASVASSSSDDDAGDDGSGNDNDDGSGPGNDGEMTDVIAEEESSPESAGSSVTTELASPTGQPMEVEAEHDADLTLEPAASASSRPLRSAEKTQQQLSDNDSVSTPDTPPVESNTSSPALGPSAVSVGGSPARAYYTGVTPGALLGTGTRFKLLIEAAPLGKRQRKILEEPHENKVSRQRSYAGALTHDFDKARSARPGIHGDNDQIEQDREFALMIAAAEKRASRHEASIAQDHRLALQLQASAFKAQQGRGVVERDRSMAKEMSAVPPSDYDAAQIDSDFRLAMALDSKSKQTEGPGAWERPQPNK